MLTQTASFRCSSCNEFISTDADRCRFCSTPVDRGSAEAASALQQKVNKACSDASYIKIVAASMYAFFGITFLPFVRVIGVVGFIITLIAVPVMLLIWRNRFGSLETNDPDFMNAKRSKNAAFFLWLAAVSAEVLLEIMSSILHP